MKELYGYEDVFEDHEVSKADEIIEDAIDDLTHIFKEEVIKTIKEAKKAKEELNLINHEIEVKKEQYRSIKEKIDRQKKYEDERVPVEVMNRIARKYTGGFSVGDYVFHVNYKYNSKKCYMCNGKKTVETFINDEKYDVRCPVCSGVGSTLEWIPVVSRSQVSGIDLKFCCRNGNGRVWSVDCIYLSGEDRGVRADEIFKSEGEAKEYIKNMGEKDVN